MKIFCILLLSIALFITENTTCMLRRLVIQRKRNLPPRRMFYCQDPELLRAQITELEKTIASHEKIMFEQHRTINDLKDRCSACPISQKDNTNLRCIQDSYIPEHNMHYGNKDHK